MIYLKNWIKNNTLLNLTTKYIVLMFPLIVLFSCENSTVKKCASNLDFTINGQYVPSGCDFFGTPTPDDLDILAIVKENEDLKIEFNNPSISFNKNLKIKLGNSYLPVKSPLVYSPPEGTGIISLQVCLGNDCLVKYVLISNDKNISKKKKTKKRKRHNAEIASSKSNTTNSYESKNTDYSNRENKYDYQASNNTYQQSTNEYGEYENGNEIITDNSTSNYNEIKSRNEQTEPAYYDTNSEPVSDESQTENTNLESIDDNSYSDNTASDEYNNQEAVQTNENDVTPEITDDNNLEEDNPSNTEISQEEEKTIEEDIPPSPEISNNNAPKTKQIGLSIASRCNSNSFVQNTSVTISPKTDLTLNSLYVYSSDIGKVTITVTASDGTDESITVNLNSGRNQILLSELYLFLEAGKTYTMYAKAESTRKNIETKLEDNKSCAKSSYSDNNISIKFKDSICFFNIKYNTM